jgi:DDE superfamily endonuclease
VNNLRRVMNQSNTPVLFLVNSHSTCKHKPTKKLFEDNNIIILVLPAHSSTILQPLDLTCNGELKRLLRANFVVVEGEDSLTKRNRLLYTSVYYFQLALRGLHIMNGFSRVESILLVNKLFFNPTSFTILLQKSLLSLLLRRREVFLLLERFL